MTLAWQVEVDGRRCMASGMCAAMAPELFALDGEHARPVHDEIDPGETGETALDAADSCPAGAITIRDGEKVIGPRP